VNKLARSNSEIRPDRAICVIYDNVSRCGGHIGIAAFLDGRDNPAFGPKDISGAPRLTIGQTHDGLRRTLDRLDWRRIDPANLWIGDPESGSGRNLDHGLSGFSLCDGRLDLAGIVAFRAQDRCRVVRSLPRATPGLEPAGDGSI
jgi:hypothetical protein